MTGRFATAVVGAPFGVKGFVKIRSLSGEYEHLLQLRTATLRMKGVERVWEVDGVQAVHQALAVKFRGIDSPEAAKALNGAELIIERAGAAALQEDEFYVEDLRDLAVCSVDGEILGHIANVVEGGGGTLVEIRVNSGEMKLAPFRKEFFGDIDFEKGTALLLHAWILE